MVLRRPRARELADRVRSNGPLEMKGADPKTGRPSLVTRSQTEGTDPITGTRRRPKERYYRSGSFSRTATF